MTLEPVHRTSFVIRIWKEPGSPYGWRGQIVEGAGHRTEYFESMEALMGLLERRLKEEGFDADKIQAR